MEAPRTTAATPTPVVATGTTAPGISASAKPPAPSGFWDDAKLVKIQHGEDCPEGFWALFDDGDVPGHDEFEQKANAGKRKQLAADARARTYVVLVKHDVAIKTYDFTKHVFPTEITDDGTISCNAPNESPTKSVTIAFSPAHPVDPTASGGDGLVGLFHWEGTPLRFEISVPEVDAKKFKDTHDHLQATIAFKIESTQSDHRKVRVTDTPSGFDDHGAGRLVKAKVLAVKIFDRDGQSVLLDTTASK